MAQFESLVPVSENPIASPALFKKYTCELLPPLSNGSAVRKPFFHTAARHCRCVPNPQKCSPFESVLAVSELTTDTPFMLVAAFSLMQEGQSAPPSVPKLARLP